MTAGEWLAAQKRRFADRVRSPVSEPARPPTA